MSHPTPMSFEVRPLQSGELFVARDLHCENLPVRFTPRFFYRMLCRTPGALVATLPSTIAVGSSRQPISKSPSIIGFVGAYFTRSARIKVYIWAICIAPEFRRHGIAQLLLDRIILRAKNVLRAEKIADEPRRLVVQLHVQAANRVAHRFYIRFGFRNVAFKPGYYDDCDDFKPLDPSLEKISVDVDDKLDAGRIVSERDAWLMELETDF